MKLNIKVIRKWVKALHSGKYWQGRGSLKILPTGRETLTRHCCLGVLCELYEKETGKKLAWEPHDLIGEKEGKLIVMEKGRAMTVLPDVVRKWAGLTDDNPYVFLTKKQKIQAAEDQAELADLNDSGIKFKSIARMIELTFLLK